MSLIPKSTFQKSWRLYSIWRKYEVHCRAPPLTQDIALAVAGWCLRHAEMTMCGLLLLGFHALLRTDELLAVRPCDFLLDSNQGLVSLPRSKSGLRNNSLETVSLHDPITIEALRAVIEVQNPKWDVVRSLCGRKVAQLSAHCLEKCWKNLRLAIFVSGHTL